MDQGTTFRLKTKSIEVCTLPSRFYLAFSHEGPYSKVLNRVRASCIGLGVRISIGYLERYCGQRKTLIKRYINQCKLIKRFRYLFIDRLQNFLIYVSWVGCNAVHWLHVKTPCFISFKFICICLQIMSQLDYAQ